MGLKNFAIDFGNGYVKAKSEKAELVFPAKLGFESDLGDSSLEDFAAEHDIDVYQKKDDIKYVMGKDIEKAINPSSLLNTNTTNERYTKDEFKDLVDFALTKLASFEDEESIDVRLVTGMPSEDLLMPGNKKAFEEFLKGRHLVEQNEKEFVVNVKELKVIEQPLGTLLNEFLNEDLQVHKTLKEGTIVVIDFGSGTTIIDIYKNMKRIGGETIKGMINFYKDIANALSKKTSKKVEPSYIEKGIRNGSFVAEFGVNSIEFKDLFEQQVKITKRTISTNYNDIVTEDEVDKFIFTGGGTHVLGDAMKKLNNEFHPVENSQLATVNGYYKLALNIEKHSK